MEEKGFSPDGAFWWDGEKWVATSPLDSTSIDIRDSVISGDIVSNTKIQTSDADVVRAAIEVAGKIITDSLGDLDNKSVEEPKPEMQFVPAPDIDFLNRSQATLPPKKFKKSFIWLVVVPVGIVAISVVLAGFNSVFLSSVITEDGPSYSLSLTSASVDVKFQQLDTEGGPSDKDIKLELYFDDEDTGQFENGEICSTLMRHHSDKQNYSLSKSCDFETKAIEGGSWSSDSHSVSITVCVSELSSGDKFDIYSGDSEGGSCVIYRSISLDYYGTVAYGSDCNYDKDTVTKRAFSGKTIAPSGLNDNDLNEWNAKFSSILTIEQYYVCNLNA